MKASSNFLFAFPRDRQVAKQPFGYTRKDIIIIGVGTTVAGAAMYYGLKAGGVSDIWAGNIVQLTFVLGLTIGWVGSYIGRRDRTAPCFHLAHASTRIITPVPLLLTNGFVQLSFPPPLNGPRRDCPHKRGAGWVAFLTSDAWMYQTLR